MARYKEAVEWIADNDEPTVMGEEEISAYISTILVADIFRKEINQVVKDILKIRKVAKSRSIKNADNNSLH